MFVRKKKILSLLQVAKDVLLNTWRGVGPIKKCTTLQLWSKGFRKKIVSNFLEIFYFQICSKLSPFPLFQQHSLPAPVLGFTNFMVRGG